MSKLPWRRWLEGLFRSTEEPVEKGVGFDLFISYSTDPDYPLVSKLASYLQSFHEIPTEGNIRLRPLRICVDAADFHLPAQAGSETLEVGALIEKYLAESAELLVLGSRNACRSAWVRDEILWFLKHSGKQKVRLAVTEWAGAEGALEEVIPAPLIEAGLHLGSWYDLRSFRQDLPGRDLADEMLRLAADLQGVPASQIRSYSKRERDRQKEEAAKKIRLERDARQRAGSLLLLNLARQELTRSDATLAAWLALEGLPRDMAAPDRPYVPEVEVELYRAMLRQRELRVLVAPVDKASFSPDGKHWIASSAEDTAIIFDLVSGQEGTVLRGQDPGYDAARFSRDSRFVLTVSWHDSAKVWEAASGQLLSTVRVPKGGVSCAALSPDGRFLLTASGDRRYRAFSSGPRSRPLVAVSGEGIRLVAGNRGEIIVTTADPNVSPQKEKVDTTARLWDVATGRLLSVLEHPAVVGSAEFSPTGQHVITLCEDSIARLWRVKTGKLTTKLRGHHERTFLAVFSPDGRYVLTASGVASSSQPVAFLSEVSTGRQTAVLEGHSADLVHAAFSPDGQRVATAAEDQTARIWEVPGGRLVTEVKGHEGVVSHVAFSPCNRFLVTASDDKTARVWKVDDGTQVDLLRGHDGAVRSAAYSADSKTIITTSLDGTLRFWQHGPCEGMVVLEGHTDKVVHACFSPDDSWVATASEDRTVGIWNGCTGALLSRIDGYGSGVQKASFAPNGRILASVSLEGTLLWDLMAGRAVSFLPKQSSGAFHPKGTKFATGSPDGKVHLWDAATGTKIATLEGHEGEVQQVAFSPDGEILASASADKTIRLWGVTTGCEFAVLATASSRVSQIAFHPQGRQLLALYENDAWLWSVPEGKLIDRLDGHLGTAIYYASFTEDGQWVVTVGADCLGRVWGTTNGDPRAILRGHGDAVLYVALSLEGRALTASRDGTARLWNLPSGHQVAVLEGHQDKIYQASFARTGRRAVTASADGTARLWRIFGSTQELINHARSKLPRPLTTEQRQRLVLDPTDPNS